MDINFIQPHAQRRKKKNLLRKMWAIFFVIAISLFVLLAFRIGFAFKQIHTSPTNHSFSNTLKNIFNASAHNITSKEHLPLEEDLYPMPNKESDRLDILVLGIRGSEDENGGFLTDTILMVSYNKKTRKAVLVSLPRDLYLRIPGIHKREKINAIYVMGLGKGMKNGLEFTRRAFSKITQIYIDNVVVVDFQAFQDIVDGLGGITITLKEPFEENKQWGYTFSLPKGDNVLDGEKALYYARSRFSSSDFDRSRRQQEIIIAIKNKILSLKILTNPLKLNKIIKTVEQNIHTDISLLGLSPYIKLALNNSDISLEHFVIDTTNFLDQSTEDNMYILKPKGGTLDSIRSFLNGLVATD